MVVDEEASVSSATMIREPSEKAERAADGPEMRMTREQRRTRAADIHGVLHGTRHMTINGSGPATGTTSCNPGPGDSYPHTHAYHAHTHDAYAYILD